ncbi:MAG: XTP/dITP diphosphatase [Candidatus Njordarchaeia archaeon]
MSLYFVTHNKHKLIEAENILNNFNIKLRLKPLKAEKIEIQADKLEDIVRFAAEWLMERGYCGFFVEDAGLFIPALNGFPGPYSSYVYKTIGCRGILKLMEKVEDRKAYFMSAIALCHKNEVKLFSGQVWGEISKDMRGEKGFGFDPIFIPRGEKLTFAEMDLEEKNRLSHRGKALGEMANYLKKEYNF